jgi:hypothetical protein
VACCAPTCAAPPANRPPPSRTRDPRRRGCHPWRLLGRLRVGVGKQRISTDYQRQEPFFPACETDKPSRWGRACSVVAHDGAGGMTPPPTRRAPCADRGTLRTGRGVSSPSAAPSSVTAGGAGVKTPCSSSMSHSGVPTPSGALRRMIMLAGYGANRVPASRGDEIPNAALIAHNGERARLSCPWDSRDCQRNARCAGLTHFRVVWPVRVAPRPRHSARVLPIARVAVSPTAGPPRDLLHEIPPSPFRRPWRLRCRWRAMYGGRCWGRRAAAVCGP